MSFNPLDCPWGKPPPPKLETKVVTESHHIGKRNEAVRDSAGASSFIIVKTVGIPGVLSTDYRLQYVPGTKLSAYLARLSLRAVALRASMRDATNPDRGKLRMSYVPSEGAVIVLSRSGISSALRFQSSNHNAEAVARRMGNGSRSVTAQWKK